MGEAWSCQRLVSRNSFRRATIIYRGRSRLYIIGVGKLGSLVIDSLLAWDSNEQLPGKSSFERKKEISIESAINRSSRVRGGSKRFRRKICTFWRGSLLSFCRLMLASVLNEIFIHSRVFRIQMDSRYLAY